ncbi:MAG: glycosyltransferase family 39 protein [Arenimonas sp.]|uniref:ArnT family glycosyltransferase n=1 Tax=Arenimonas sp. TaxID=1872635 RepID=UPI0025C2D025|nr:glycosyltransferase family 39 protein [Arenimonas sp.]MBW8366708.1 glycosyltransferase family 39 protein [Arenimonas sp.]
MGLGSLRVKFIVAWAVLLLAKLWLAATLLPFGDEAFYALESRRLAWAYSDLPGLTAWLIRLGTELGGQHVLAIRAPFVLVGAMVPWLVVRIARRWFGAQAGWQAGMLALLMPLSGLSGVLALPDAPMLLAALLCLDAFAALLQRFGAAAALQLALGLALGAFSHYRFALVVLAGAAGLLCTARGRALLREPGLWLALAVGAAAWLPLVVWNVGHAGAGGAFQFVDRHPWQLQGDGAWWPVVQALIVTPALFALLLATLWRAWRQRHSSTEPQWPLLLGVAGVSVLGYFAMAFVSDSERVSFHWPLPGWLALACAAPVVLASWPRWTRAVVHGMAATGLLLVLGYLAVVTQPAGRQWLATGPAYADNFSGWDLATDAVRSELALMPAGTALVADNFMLGAQLAFALDRSDVAVLPHPLNNKHGRAVQLSNWGLLASGREAWGDGPVLLVVEDTSRSLKRRLDGYRELCSVTGGLPPPRVLNVDHGRKRFLLFRLPSAGASCSTPALAWLEAPAPGAEPGATVDVSGWALKEGVGVDRVQVTVDGRVVAEARLDPLRPDVSQYWGVADGSDGAGFGARLDLTDHPGGDAWLGLVVHGRDGSVEAWPEQRLRIPAQGRR